MSADFVTVFSQGFCAISYWAYFGCGNWSEHRWCSGMRDIVRVCTVDIYFIYRWMQLHCRNTGGLFQQMICWYVFKTMCVAPAFSLYYSGPLAKCQFKHPRTSQHRSVLKSISILYEIIGTAGEQTGGLLKWQVNCSCWVVIKTNFRANPVLAKC